MTPLQYTNEQLQRTGFLSRTQRGNFINGQELPPHSGK